MIRLLKTIFLLTLLVATMLGRITTSSSAFASPETYAGPELCKSCHPEAYEEWSKGKHKAAFSDLLFQQEWTRQGKPGACLTCHSTGYEGATGQFAFEGVTCESCHGVGMHPIPGGAMISFNASLCGRCHGGERFPTVDEWAQSKHAKSLEALKPPSDQNPSCLECHSATQVLAQWLDRKVAAGEAPITCQVCHSPHQTELRIRPSDELCGRCHVGRHEAWSDDSPHGLLNISCETCHRYTKGVNETLRLGLPGHEAITGHTFKILREDGKPLVCGNCHGKVEGILSYEGAVDAMVRIQNRIDVAAEDLLSMLFTAEQSIKQANATEGADPAAIREASAILDATKRVFETDIVRDYSKGFHNPAGTMNLINNMIRNASKAQIVALQGVIGGMVRILNTTSGQVNHLVTGLTTAQENIRLLEANQRSLQQTLSEVEGNLSSTVVQLRNLTYVNSVLVSVVIASMILVGVMVILTLRWRGARTVK